MRTIFLLVCFTVPHLASSQNRTLDSLATALKNHPRLDTIRVRILLTTCALERNSYPQKNKIHAEEALKISKETHFVQGEGEAIRCLAHFYWSQGDFETSTKYGYEALRIFESISYTKGLGSSYMLLGTIHLQQNDFEKAKVFHLKALEMFQRGNDKKNLGYAYNSLGLLYLNSSQYELALENFGKSMELRKEINDKDGIGQSYVNFAFVYLRQKKYTDALDYFKKSLSLGLDNTYRQMIIHEGIAKCYGLMGEDEKAEISFGTAVGLGKRIHNNKKLEDMYEELSLLEKRRGRFKDALAYYELANTYKDSLFTEDKTKKMAEMEAKYETEQKDQRIQLLERDQQIQSLWRNIFLIASISTLLLSLVIYILQKYRARKNHEILNLQIDSLISQQHELSEKYRKTVLNDESEKQGVSQDQRLLKKAIATVENNMSDPLFGVEQLAQEMGMSRTNMHRRIKSVTGFPPSDFIRSIRLRKAALLLQQASDSVSQISFAVGFDDPSYFSKAFKKEFGKSPSAYAQSTTQSTD